MIDIKTRVSKGAARMDEVMPGWASELDLDMFEIHLSHQCVLGQSFNNYAEGLRTLFPEHTNPKEGWFRDTMHDAEAEYGFTVRGEDYPGTDYDTRQVIWTELQQTWLDAILERRAA